MKKDKPVEEEIKEESDEEEIEEKSKEQPKKETPGYEPSPCLPNINGIIDNIVKCLPDNINISPREKEPELCELHIVGTPELILKILKIE